MFGTRTTTHGTIGEAHGAAIDNVMLASEVRDLIVYAVVSSVGCRDAFGIGNGREVGGWGVSLVMWSGVCDCVCLCYVSLLCIFVVVASSLNS